MPKALETLMGMKPRNLTQSEIDEKVHATLTLWSRVIRLRDGLVDDVKQGEAGAQQQLDNLDKAIAEVEMRKAGQARLIAIGPTPTAIKIAQESIERLLLGLAAKGTFRACSYELFDAFVCCNSDSTPMTIDKLERAVDNDRIRETRRLHGKERAARQVLVAFGYPSDTTIRRRK
ncbi:MAG: hypothetical protein GY813_13420 [Halieaceae bacterium]|nr:hypothetical protein [Halieaceae bacterium]